MNQQYIELVNNFKELTGEDKKQEILNNINELLRLLYITNKTYNEFNEVLPILTNYSNDNDYYDALFTNIISLKEETAKLIQLSKQ